MVGCGGLGGVHCFTKLFRDLGWQSQSIICGFQGHHGHWHLASWWGRRESKKGILTFSPPVLENDSHLPLARTSMIPPGGNEVRVWENSFPARATQRKRSRNLLSRWTSNHFCHNICFLFLQYNLEKQYDHRKVTNEVWGFKYEILTLI